MSYQFEIRHIPVEHALFTRKTCKHTELGEAFGEMLPLVFQYAHDSGAQPNGAPFGRYTAWRADDCDVEAGIPVANVVAGADGIVAGHMGGCTAIVTTHIGPYDTLNEAHEATLKWLADNGKQVNGAPYEMYVNDPTEIDPAEWETVVVYPIAD